MAVPSRRSLCMPAWEACQCILNCSAFEQLSGAVLRPLAESVNANRGVFLQFMGLPLRGVLLERQTYLGDENRLATDAYAADGLYVDDPLLQLTFEWLQSRSDRCATALTLLSQVPDWREHITYSRFLCRFDIGHVLAVAIPASTVLGREMLCLGLHRPQQAPPFSHEDVGRLEGFMPIVRSALLNLAHQEAARLSGTAVDALSDAGGGLGLALLDQDLQIRQANRHALEQFRACGSLIGAIRNRLLDAAPKAGTETEALLSISDPCAEPARSVKMQARTFHGTDSHVFHWVLLTNAAAGGDPKHAASSFGLTSREEEVAILVCEGKSNPAIGHELGVTRRTVENHLRTIYQKVGVNSRTQLVSRLLGSRANARLHPGS